MQHSSPLLSLPLFPPELSISTHQAPLCSTARLSFPCHCSLQSCLFQPIRLLYAAQLTSPFLATVLSTVVYFNPSGSFMQHSSPLLSLPLFPPELSISTHQASLCSTARLSFPCHCSLQSCLFQPIRLLYAAQLTSPFLATVLSTVVYFNPSGSFMQHSSPLLSLPLFPPELSISTHQASLCSTARLSFPCHCSFQSYLFQPIRLLYAAQLASPFLATVPSRVVYFNPSGSFMQHSSPLLFLATVPSRVVYFNPSGSFMQHSSPLLSLPLFPPELSISTRQVSLCSTARLCFPCHCSLQSCLFQPIRLLYAAQLASPFLATVPSRVVYFNPSGFFMQHSSPLLSLPLFPPELSISTRQASLCSTARLSFPCHCSLHSCLFQPIWLLYAAQLASPFLATVRSRVVYFNPSGFFMQHSSPLLSLPLFSPQLSISTRQASLCSTARLSFPCHCSLHSCLFQPVRLLYAAQCFCT